MHHIKPYLKNLERLRAGTYRDSKSGLFLDRNERSVPYDSKIVEALFHHLKNVNFGLYPELEPFYQKLSNWLGIPDNQIYVTEGVSGAIKSLVETLTIPEKHNIVFPYPTFAMYPVYCEMFSVEPRMVGYTNSYKLDYENLIDSIDKNTAIVFLPNPNMPIEGTLSIEEIANVAKKCLKHKVILAIDEVYYPYGGPTAIELVDNYDNLFVMQSFSKAFGLAGIRVGYVVSNAKNINYVSKTRTGYETNSFSMEIASFFIDHYDVILDYVKQVKEGFSYLKSELKKLNIEFNGGNTGNFIFINIHDAGMARKIVNNLMDKKIYIRGRWPSPYDTGFSVTGAPMEIMEKFFEEFYQVYRSLSK